MIEVEIKCKIDNKEKLQKSLISLGFAESSHEMECDSYYDNETAAIRKNDTALRIRKVTDMHTGDVICQINYKGPKSDTLTMTRPEFETAIETAEEMDSILQALGYDVVDPLVKKERIQYVNGDIHAYLDEVYGLGTFLELEIIAKQESEKKEALQRIEKLLNMLGYSMQQTTTVSYLTQLQFQKKGNKEFPPSEDLWNIISEN